jgi:hypothetical protein
VPDFNTLVPKGLAENLQYRIDLRKRAAVDLGFRRALLAASKHDILFWFNAFCFLFEPRTRFGSDGRQLPKIIPFITWPHQDPIILEIRKLLGSRDVGIEKSRGEGMSWIGVLFALHDWLFDPSSKVGLVSNTEKKADDPGNMDSLFAKIDWELTKLPRWMAGERDRDWKRNLSDHSLVNHRNFAQINSFAATSDAGRGGRYKWFLCDELAFWDRPNDSKFMVSIRGATDSRLVISTPNGSEGEYYTYMKTPSSVVTLTLDWKDNPTRNRGLYEFKGGKPVAVDPLNNPLLKSYDPPTPDVLDVFSKLRRKGFRMEGRRRSPWYDDECNRADATPHTVAQELDRDYGGSVYKYFGNDFMEQAGKGVRAPEIRGILSYHPETLKPDFDKSDDGQLLIWCPLDIRKRPPKHQYVVAADVGTGLGGSYTSNSVACVLNLNTSEQVAEFASNTMPAADFADYCMAMAKWFYDAFLIWEHNGPGASFTNRVKLQNYGNTYRRKSQFKNSVKYTNDLGWWTTRDTKESMFSAFYQAVKSGELTVRSDDMVKECAQYVRINGRISHVLAGTTEDQSSRGEAHGDRVIAACVGLQAAKERPLASQALAEETLDNPSRNTMAWREKYHKELNSADRNEWDGRTADDLASGEKLFSTAF